MSITLQDGRHLSFVGLFFSSIAGELLVSIKYLWSVMMLLPAEHTQRPCSCYALTWEPYTCVFHSACNSPASGMCSFQTQLRGALHHTHLFSHCTMKKNCRLNRMQTYPCKSVRSPMEKKTLFYFIIFSYFKSERMGPKMLLAQQFLKPSHTVHPTLLSQHSEPTQRDREKERCEENNVEMRERGRERATVWDPENLFLMRNGSEKSEWAKDIDWEWE